jgi:ribosomal protein L19E
MTEVELIGVCQADEVSKQRKVAPKKGTGKRKGKSKAKKESSDESDPYVDNTYNEVEILDCIEVEM